MNIRDFWRTKREHKKLLSKFMDVLEKRGVRSRLRNLSLFAAFWGKAGIRERRYNGNRTGGCVRPRFLATMPKCPCYRMLSMQKGTEELFPYDSLS
jgi:hypothetical protein